MPRGMASCPLDFPRPGFLPAGFCAAWRLVRWIFRGMASFPLDFSRLRFSLGSSPRRRPRGYERGLAEPAAAGFRGVLRKSHDACMSAAAANLRIIKQSPKSPCSHSVFWVCVRSFSGRLARGRNIILFKTRACSQGFCCRSAVSQECEGEHPQSTVDLHAFLGRQFVRM